MGLTVEGGLSSSEVLAATGAVIPRVDSGLYAAPAATAFSTLMLTAARLHGVPVWLPDGASWDRMRAEVTLAGTAGSVIRLGLYADDGTGEPGTLVVDAGTIDGTSATVQEIVIAVGPLAGGLYWLCLVGQGAPLTEPTVRNWTGTLAFNGMSTAMTATDCARFVAGVAGALPAAFGAGTPSFQGPLNKMRRV